MRSETCRVRLRISSRGTMRATKPVFRFVCNTASYVARCSFGTRLAANRNNVSLTRWKHWICDVNKSHRASMKTITLQSNTTRTSRLHKLLVILGLSATTLVPTTSRALLLTLTQGNNTSDRLVFETGAYYETVNGNFGATDTFVLPESADRVFFVEKGYIYLGPAPGTRTIYLLEGSLSGPVSDILHYSWNGAGEGVQEIDGYFQSDFGNGNLGPLPADANPNDVFVEDGTQVNVTGTGIQLLTIQADLDTQSVGVPETGPGAAGLLTLVGLCGFGLVQHLRRQPAR